MKSKLFKVLGVVAIVAMLATSLVAPIAAMSGVSASITAGSAVISQVGNYTVNVTLGAQLLGTSSYALTLPYVGDAVTFTGTATTDKVVVSLAGITPALTNATFVGGVLSFSTVGGTAVFTAVTANTLGSYTDTVGTVTPTISHDNQGLPTCTTAAGAYTLPDVGDTIVFTATAAGTATLSSFPGVSVVFAPTTCGSYAAGVITFTAAGTATVSSTVAQISGLWTSGGTAPSGAAGANVANPVVIGVTATANGDTITLTFPTGFTIGTPAAGIGATSGWVMLPTETVPTYRGAHLTPGVTTISGVGQTVVISIGAGDFIGNGAQVLINLTAGVTNTAVAGTYTLTVATSQETTPVTSNSFTISNPIIVPLPGVASVYNTAGVLMSQSNSLTVALAAVGAGGTIKLSAGTYNTDFGTVPCTVAFTLQGTDASAAAVVIKSTVPWSLTGATVVIDKVTIDGTTGALTMTNATAGTISNSVIKGAPVIFSGAGTNTVDTDTVTVLTAANGLVVSAATTVKNSTFSVAGTGIGISSAANVTVSGSTFTGVAGAGTGIALTGGAASVIGSSTFTGLATALSVTGAGATFNGNTVDACGVATGPDTIMVTSTSGLTIMNNKITNSKEYIINVAANGTAINVMLNTFKGNAKAAANASGLMCLFRSKTARLSEQIGRPFGVK
jgi:Right handed beta helix region